MIPTYNALKGVASLGILMSHMAYVGQSANPLLQDIWKVFMKNGAV